MFFATVKQCMYMLVISDIHTEMLDGWGRQFVADLADTDVVVVAGDLGTKTTIVQVLCALCKKFDDVVYVYGNHELYYNHVSKLCCQLQTVRKKMPNFHWLNNRAVTIGNREFVGSTLWFANDPVNALYRMYLNDFTAIPAFVPWVYRENERAVRYLTETVTNRSIVVTHHAPSIQSMAPDFVGSPLNRFFVCEQGETIIRTKSPAYWVHGHTHGACEYTIGSTSVVCNPLGYPDELNTGFVYDKRIRI